MFFSATTTWLPWILKLIVVLALAAFSRQVDTKIQSDARRVQIVVLGDIGRSPRMQYHALSVAKHGGHAELIGYKDSSLHRNISSASNISVEPLTPFPTFLKPRNRALFAILAPLKVLFQVWTLWSALGRNGQKSGWMLVQNPPSIPTLAIAVVGCRIWSTRLIIDWHNFGYTILALKLGSRHPLVLVSKWFERAIGRYAYAHLSVTNAMGRVLRDECKISSTVLTLHDRPSSTFQAVDKAECGNILDSLSQSLSASLQMGSSIENTKLSIGSLSISESLEKAIRQNPRAISDLVRSGQLRVLVSSTSWTADEDFSILLEAVEAYCQNAKKSNTAVLPRLLIIITGKGPLKEAFGKQVKHSDFQGKLSCALILTAYFEDVEDYAALLACADLGISLHTSSSGLDLPMKVVDMFGAGLPVIGWGDFESWSELVKEGSNGMSFSSAAQLQHLLESLFKQDSKVLKRLKKGALDEGRKRWNDEWDPIAGKLLGLVNVKKSTKDQG